jgi:N-acetylglucosamine kinase-like BadF-type ATPase
VTDVVAGLDIGGTKASLMVENLEGRVVLESVLPSGDWDAEPVSAGADWVARLLASVLPGGLEVRALGIGAQGLDSRDIATTFEAALADRGLRVRAVNDAALLLPAAGLRQGFGVIAGTGSIVIGVDASGNPLFTGGWGWVLGDEAGAADLVRDATRAALRAHDDGEPDDGLLAALTSGFEVTSAERLARAVNDEPTMANWGPRSRVVFAAADEGSELARGVVDLAARQLAHHVSQLVRRGGVGSDVVVAGSVILNQPRLYDAFAGAVDQAHPGFAVRRLDVEPVVGAIALARQLVEESSPLD